MCLLCMWTPENNLCVASYWMSDFNASRGQSRLAGGAMIEVAQVFFFPVLYRRGVTEKLDYTNQIDFKKKCFFVFIHFCY